MDLRKHLIVVEEIGSEGGHKLARPVRRVAGIAVIVNPYAGRNVEDLSPLCSTLGRSFSPAPLGVQ